MFIAFNDVVERVTRSSDDEMTRTDQEEACETGVAEEKFMTWLQEQSKLDLLLIQ